MTGREAFYKTIQKIHHLEGIKALLDWDSQVYMPDAGASVKADHLELVSVLLHKEVTHPDLEREAEALLVATPVSDHPDHINAKTLLKTITREKKLSEDFVAKRSKLHTETFHLWQKAKQEKNYSLVKNNLIKIFATAQEEAHLVGFQEHMYDALLDQYEPGGRVSWVRPLLETLAASLRDLLQSYDLQQPKAPVADFSLSLHDQHALGVHLMEAFGLPRSASRLDVSSHPFCTTIGHDDVRITTRFQEQDFLYGLGSILHELGHALYEYHLPQTYRGSACGSVFSLGMHESQSRFIENCVGRSHEFAVYLARYVQDTFKKAVSAEAIYQRQNQVARSLIRVDADEVTYSLHIVIRMLLEIDLMSGALSCDALPEAWNALYQNYLGITPRHDAEGILQDVHWYSGAIGYFPTYALGNVFDGVILNVIKKSLPDFARNIEQGNFLPTTNWLKEHIHVQASRLESRAMIASLQGGTEVTAQPFILYIQDKLQQAV
jgi:carboxypeptidase Taq